MGRRPRSLAALPVAAALLTAGCSTSARPATAPAAETSANATTSTTTPGVTLGATTVVDTTTSGPTTIVVPEEVGSFESDRGHETAPAPVAVAIPAIGVTSDLEELHRDAEGIIEVPTWHHAGWWAEGPKPGQLGPAVILGHVDSREGPDVFYRLHELQPGDEVVVTRADGSTVRFAVERVERHPKDAFPTDQVYAPSLEAGLRLVTCGGDFDQVSGHYRDNVIAFATMTP